MRISKREERIGIEKYNKWNELIKVVEYESAQKIIVEFQDDWKERKQTDWKTFCEGNIVNPHRDTVRKNASRKNNQGCLMKVLEYKNFSNVLIEFQDEYKYRTKTTWSTFISGGIKNPYYPNVCGIGITGIKYPVSIKEGNKTIYTREYKAWSSMITRCYTKTFVNGDNYYHRYEEAEICKEWLLYENFYEWLHSQENFEQLMKISDIEIDKDILLKGNKIYSTNTCCLVPHRVNTLFIKANKARGKYPIGVTYKTRDEAFEVQCSVDGKEIYLGRAKDPIEGFNMYKEYKEKVIKQIAKEEYNKGNITKICYEAMMKYEVEITD